MFKVKIRPHWEISVDAAPALDTAVLLALLQALQEHSSIITAAREAGLSYRYAWGLLREAEALFGEPLLETRRGRGTTLTPLAQKMVWADRRIAARLSPTLESLASELEIEIGKARARGHGAAAPTIRMDASHGYAVAALMGYVDRQSLPVELRYRTSIDAVTALARNECDLAGFHVPEGEFEARTAQGYLRWLDPARHSLVHLAGREQGLLVAPGNPQAVTGLRDLTRPGLRFVNRQAGSGTRMLLEMMLEGAAVDPAAIHGWNSAELTHSAVAAYIASGMADAGIGMRAAAEQFKLGFIPLVRERYLFAVRTEALQDGLLAGLLAALRDPGYQRLVAALPGYDATRTGEVESLQAAFPD